MEIPAILAYMDTTEILAHKETTGILAYLETSHTECKSKKGLTEADCGNVKQGTQVC